VKGQDGDLVDEKALAADGLVLVRDMAQREDVWGLMRELSNPAEHGITTVRGHAARGLGKLRAEEAVERLGRLLADEHEFVRLQTVDALADIDTHRSRDLLLNALNDESELVQRTAALRLGEAQVEQALPLLVETSEE
jgi:HEAT repeat protein